jgi:hypothetical protein
MKYPWPLPQFQTPEKTKKSRLDVLIASTTEA